MYSPRVREIGVRSPVATDLSRKNRQWQLHCQTLGNRWECHGSSEMTIINGCPCHNSCGTLKNPHCSMTMSTEQRSKFAALQRQRWRLYRSEKFSSGTISSKPNIQTNDCTQGLERSNSYQYFGIKIVFLVNFQCLVVNILNILDINKS